MQVESGSVIDGHRVIEALGSSGRFAAYRVTLRGSHDTGRLYVFDEPLLLPERFHEIVHLVHSRYPFGHGVGRECVLPEPRMHAGRPWFVVSDEVAVLGRDGVLTPEALEYLQLQLQWLAELEPPRDSLWNGPMAHGDLHPDRILLVDPNQPCLIAPGWAAAADAALRRDLARVRSDDDAQMARFRAATRGERPRSIDPLRRSPPHDVSAPHDVPAPHVPLPPQAPAPSLVVPAPHDVSAPHLPRPPQAPAPSLVVPAPARAEISHQASAPRIPQVLDDDVQFTVYRPESIPPKVWKALLVFVHKSKAASPGEPHPLELVNQRARGLLGDSIAEYGAARQDAPIGIPRESELTLVPYALGIDFNPSEHRFTWQEPVHQVEFRMRSLQLDERTVHGGIRVFVGVLLVAEIPLRFVVSSQELDPVLTSASAGPLRRVFPSYSHADAAIVAFCERCAEALGFEYLRDVRMLRAGERWSERIEQLIREANVFQLFWSSNSMSSPHVRAEWELALALGKPMCPVYWERPFPQNPLRDLPPLALRALHFVDLSGQRSAAEFGVDGSPSRKSDAPPSGAGLLGRKLRRDSGFPSGRPRTTSGGSAADPALEIPNRDSPPIGPRSDAEPATARNDPPPGFGAPPAVADATVTGTQAAPLNPAVRRGRSYIAVFLAALLLAGLALVITWLAR